MRAAGSAMGLPTSVAELAGQVDGAHVVVVRDTFAAVDGEVMAEPIWSRRSSRRPPMFQTLRREVPCRAVPKIDARTVAEHRDLHHTKLLDAAVATVAAQDVTSLTLSELAKRTGRSRASTYAYFASTDDLRAEVCAHVLGEWVARVLDEIRQASDPDDRLDRLVSVQIRLRVEPAVDHVLAFVQASRSTSFQDRIRRVLEPLTAELLDLIGRLGVEPPTRAASVVQAAVAAAYDQVRAGADPDQVAEDTIVFVRAGLAALRRTEPGGRSGRGGRGGTAASEAPGPAGAARPVGSSAIGPGALAMTVSPSPAALRALLVLAVVASVVALAARTGLVDGAAILHVVLACVLLVGLSGATRSIWRTQRSVAVAARGL